MESVKIPGPSPPPGFKLRTQLVQLISFQGADPWEGQKLGTENVDVDKLLAAFSNWRITALESGAMVVDHAVAHLLSGLDFDGGTKGYVDEHLQYILRSTLI